MDKKSNITKQAHAEPVRKLSPFRVILAIGVIAGLFYVSTVKVNDWKENRINSSQNPWFASYVDATATPFYSFEQLGSTSTKNVVLSFIVSSKDDACIPSWAGYYDLDQASTNLDLDRRIARLRQKGGDVSVSFGGLLNDELALKCEGTDRLLKAYKTIIDRYALSTIDLDLEGEELSDSVSSIRRAMVLAKLQRVQKDQNKNLAIWLTLPVAPQGLTKEGTDAVLTMLKNGVDLAGVNVMTMDYGNSRDNRDSMGEASKKALLEVHRQLGILYKQAGFNLNSATLWTKIGATPMIGQNDVRDEVFSLEDARMLNEFATSKRIGRMSMWSANRDIQCGENYVDTKVVSDACSGVKQEKLQFSDILSFGFKGGINENASITTKNEESDAKEIIDDPETSPYQIWTKGTAYLTGTKIVWKKNVYQAKWWTKGDLPDNPVLQSWETPWQLIGPVLPNEKPIPQITLKPGTYPEWSGNVEYIAGKRVIFEGTPYQAKWWTKGDSPAISRSNSDISPWVPLTATQIEFLIKDQE